jgi:hypothetical protein
MRLCDELSLVRKGIKSIKDLKKDFLFEEHNVPKDYEKFVESLNIFKNDMLFQGTIVYAEGTAKNLKKIEKKLTDINFKIYGQRILKRDGKGTLRPTDISFLTKGDDNYKIKIALVFSHNKYIKSYLYNFPSDNVFVLNPMLTRKFIKQHKKLKEHDFIDDFQIIYLNSYLDFNQTILEKIEYARFLKRGTCILYRDVKTYDKFADKMNEIINEDWFGFVEGVE